MIAVCLLTCGRTDLTQRTVDTFAAHNVGRADLELLHVDAGPAGDDQDVSCAIAAARGFQTILAPRARMGQIESFNFFLGWIGGVRGAELMLWLENDWESSAPIPTLRFLRSTPNIDQWRLYGKTKMREKGPRFWAGTKRLGANAGEPIEWRPSELKGWERTDRAHWAAGGSIVRPEALRPFAGAARMKDVILAANELPTMRTTKNILWHIGLTTTPGFRG